MYFECKVRYFREVLSLPRFHHNEKMTEISAFLLIETLLKNTTSKTHVQKRNSLRATFKQIHLIIIKGSRTLFSLILNSFFKRC